MSPRPQLDITKLENFRFRISIANPSSSAYISKSFIIDSRLPVARKLYTFIKLYGNLISDETMRELTRMLLNFLDFPTVQMDARLVSFMEMIEINLVETLLPDAANTSDISELREIFKL